MWSPAWKGLLALVCDVSLSHWYPGSGVVLDCGAPLVSNSLIKIGLTFQAFVRPSVYSQIGHLLASFLFYVVSIWLNMTSTYWSPSQGFWETGEMTFIPGEQETKVKFWVEQGTKAILGSMEHKKTIFDSWGTGKQAYLFQGNKGTDVPLGGSHICLSTRHIKLCLWSTDSCELQNMYIKILSFAFSSNIHCNLWPHTMINTTFAVEYAAEIYEVSLLS